MHINQDIWRRDERTATLMTDAELLTADELSDLASSLHKRGEYKLALELFKAAGLRGSVDALYTVGLMYSNGQGVRRNAVTSAKWLLRAAEAGSDYAQYSIGVDYFTGTGVKKDLGRSLMWLSLASRTGYDRPHDWIPLVRAEMSEEEIVRAELLAAQMAKDKFQSTHSESAFTRLAEYHRALERDLAPLYDEYRKALPNYSHNLESEAQALELVRTIDEAARPILSKGLAAGFTRLNLALAEGRNEPNDLRHNTLSSMRHFVESLSSPFLPIRLKCQSKAWDKLEPLMDEFISQHLSEFEGWASSTVNQNTKAE